MMYPTVKEVTRATAHPWTQRAKREPVALARLLPVARGDARSATVQRIRETSHPAA
jgi:hypothetical protein